MQLSWVMQNGGDGHAMRNPWRALRVLKGLLHLQVRTFTPACAQLMVFQ
jgi:hypothetical protein